ncbi:hypothetical protein FHS31_000856 [Sphingomonas vulcanisoli]|uniref:Uncharacterized protein n=1 Tax=Sphingomonas vulcanisoli TaxID=1658060 RepID=A0ABX0TSP3_9SPHN|nr:hypothetical protein [Sphingomonas vulcanisoli]NIJ07260.1 hypothetical protein [Sphingomonas vulcanisoli]
MRRTLGQMVDNGFTAFARCRGCGKVKQIDLDALIAKVGRDYSLWNRRCRCRLTEGCSGWNIFEVGPGWHVAAYDPSQDQRWLNEDYQERMAADAAAGVKRGDPWAAPPIGDPTAAGRSRSPKSRP